MATLTGDNGDNTLIGTEEEDVINGLGGNDTIDSVDRPANIFAGSIAPRRDVVNAGEGDDFVTGGKLDQLNGGAGNDFLLVNFNFNGPVVGSAAPIALTLDANGTGTASDGTFITSFESVNLFLSDTGDNVVDTSNVQAQLSGGGGNDTLTTGSANDGVFGGAGDDVISTGGGNDTISGGFGDDTVMGGEGDDRFGVNLLTDGSDMVDLGAGNDTVTFDRFDGGTGNVRITFTSAQVGNGIANDSNTMANQDGGLAVRVQSEDADGNLTGAVSRYDDEGITFLAGTQGITMDVRDLVSGAARGDTFEGVVLGSSGTDALTFFPPFRGGQNFYYNAGMGDDVVVAGEGNDFLVGGGGDDQLSGNGGNDSFIGGGGNDNLFGGAGIDTAIVNVTTDGADTVDLGAGSDIVNVSAAAAGQVRLTFTSAQVGNGNPNDSNTMANQDGGIAVRLQAEDGSGNLTGPVSRYDDEGISFVAGAGVTFDVRDLVSGVQRGDQFEVATLGTAAGDTLTAVQGARSYYINAGMGDDDLTGGTANDFLVGGAGNDSLSGGDGNDSFIGGAGNDSFNGGAGTDRAIFAFSQSSASVGVAADGSTIITSPDGTDTFRGVEQLVFSDGTLELQPPSSGVLRVGTAGSDVLSGEVGNDTLRGAAGDDDLRGGLGNDDLNGGLGNDTVSGGDGNDTVVGADGNDAINGGSGEDQLFGQAGNDTVTAGLGNDKAFGDAGNDQVFGQAGNDTVFGGAGADLLRGDEGNDRLSGDAGTDTLRGGSGNDLLTGGADADVFVFSGADVGQDRITDFTVGMDRLDLRGIGLYSEAGALAAATSDALGQAVITVGSISLTLEHLTITQLQAGGDFLV